jgi:hypothetical protein
MDHSQALALPARYMGARLPIYQVYTNISLRAYLLKIPS